jgi:hypothetical protein
MGDLMTYTQDTIHELLPKLNKRQIASAVHRGLPAQKIGRNWYFDAEAVRAWLSGKPAQPDKRAARAAKADDPAKYPDEVGE